MTAAGELSWPPAGSFLAAYGEILTAADTAHIRRAISQLWPGAGVAAVMVWWRVLQARVVQLRHGTKMGAVWR
jgi:hypothetical protein